MPKFELISTQNFTEASLDSFTRTQQVTKVYRKTDDSYSLVEDPFVMDWSPERKREVANELLSGNYIAYAAFDENRKIVGFMGLAKNLVGDYMILEMIQVDANYRGQGIERNFFLLAKKEAIRVGARDLYISACPSEETIAFYKAMGAEYATEIIKEMADKEPYDVQMVCYI